MKVLRDTRRSPRLRIERLEDRLTPASATATTTEMLALTTSAQPLRDLQNVVAAFGLANSIDLSRSSVVLSAGGSSLLDVALTSQADYGFIQARLRGTGLYSSVSPNYVYSDVGDLREHLPNDPLYAQQYYPAIISAPAAWDKTVGTPDVVVAILDDGVATTQPDMKNTLWTNPKELAGDGVDNDANGFIDDVHGWNFVANTNDVNPTDPIADSHGTEVAGVLAAQIDNAAGVAGVAGGIRFMPLKVVGTGGGTTSLTLARAVGYAMQNGAKIINTSINVDPFADDPTFTAAMDLAYDRGVLLVNSAGNSNANGPPRLKLEDALFVAASDRNDVKTPYSNYGSGVDVTAPGGTADDGLLTTTPGGYAPGFGTSMASPIVAGVAALVWSAFPNYTRDQVAAAVLATADDLSAKNPGYDEELGSGRVNAERAVSGAPIVTRFGKLTGLPAEGADAPSSLGSFNLHLRSPLDPATVTLANFELRWAGPDNVFGDADDVLLPLDLNGGRDYKIGTNDLQFTVNQTLSRGLYRFTARSGGLADPFGTPVDGDGNGTAGGDLVRNFGVAYQVGGQVYQDVNNDGYRNPYDPGLAGIPVFVDQNGNGLLDRYTLSQPLAVPIPDASATGATGTVSVSGLDTTSDGLTVSVFVTHDRPADLTFTLVGPNGVRVRLATNRVLANPFGTNSFVYTFQDGIAETTDGTDTLTKYLLRPEQPLAAIGTVNGDWRVEVIDSRAGEAGILNSVSLSFAGEPTAVTDANGFYQFNGLPAGTAYINVADVPGYARAAAAGAVPVDTTLPPGQAVNLGVVPSAGIVGRILAGDSAASGVGLAGVQVFLDSNHNGRPDDFEPSTVTDGFGNYTFTGVGSNSYQVTAVVPAGYVAQSATRTAEVTAAQPLVLDQNILLQRDTRPAVVTIDPVTPALRNTPVEEIDFTLSEPLPGLSLGNLSLSRDGQLLPLDGATLIHSGLTYSIIGLGGLTAAGGLYAFGVAAPGPAGEPGRAPAFVATTWTTDLTSPVLSLTPVVENGRFVGLTVLSNAPINGLTTAAFSATDGQGRPVALLSATLTLAADRTSAVLRFPAAAAAVPGLRVRLNGAGGTITDDAGNAFAGTLDLTSPVTGTPPLPAGRRTVAGADAGGSPTVRVIDPATGAVLRTLLAFEPDFTGGVRVATGDVNHDGVDDIIMAAGPGGAPRVRILDGVSYAPIADFLAFEPTFTGGLFVSAGDLNGDGTADLVLSPDTGGGPRVRILDGGTLSPLADFFGIADASFRGGARTAVGDLTGDGTPDVLVSAGFGGGPRVAGYDGRSLTSGEPRKVFADFFAFDPGLRNGVYLAAGKLDGDAFSDLVIGAGPGGGPRVLVLSGQALTTTGSSVALADFFAGDVSSRAGVRVTAKDATSGPGVLVVADGLGAGNHVRQYAGSAFGQNPPPAVSDVDVFDGLLASFSGVFVG